MLELRNVVKHYKVGDGEPIRAVDGVSMRVERGEMVVLYGPSGSGKTTLLQLIAAVLTPDKGEILVSGQDVHHLPRKQRDRYRLRELGVIGQPSDLISGARAIENASLKLWLARPRRDRGGADIEGLLERLGLGERMRHRTEQLSMGERQRVMIAQALSTEPALVLADEPTGNLDTQRTIEVLSLLSELCRERQTAILLVTHDPQAAMFADRVHELQDGKLHEYVPAVQIPTSDTA